MPKISVIIPSYNAREYLPAAIESVLAQSYQDFELIVFDDGSKDGTKDLVARFRKKHPDKIRYFYHENSGLAATRISAVKEVRGDYIAFLDADDEWFPSKLEVQMSFIEENPEFGMVFTDFKLKEQNIIVRETFVKDVSRFDGKTEVSVEDLIERNFIFPSTVLLKKECYRDGLYFCNVRAVPCNEDYEMWLKLIQNHRIGYINTPLCVRNFHDSNISRLQDRQFFGELYVLGLFLKRCTNSHHQKLVRRRIQRTKFNLAYFYFHQNKRSESRKIFSETLKVPKYSFRSLFYLFWLALPVQATDAIRSLKRKLKVIKG